MRLRIPTEKCPLVSIFPYKEAFFNLFKQNIFLIGFTLFWDNDIKLNMLNEFEKLKDELSVLYPGVTDIELNEITDNLITFFTLSAEAVLETRKAETSLSDIDDS